jgi:hypothetical protein
MTTGEYSVVQFFADDTYEIVRERVEAKEAVETAKSFTERPAALIGIIKRVIIVDAGDFINFEWRFGEGVVYPPRDAEGKFVADHPAAG